MSNQEITGGGASIAPKKTWTLHDFLVIAKILESQYGCQWFRGQPGVKSSPDERK